MKLQQLSTTQRFLAGCGCVAVLAAGAAALIVGYFAAASTRRFSRQLAAAPAGWTDSARAMARQPDLSGLTLPLSEAGDGSAVAHDSAQAWGQASVEVAYRALINPSWTAGAEDSATWRSVLADTSLDRFVAAARQRDWRALDRVLPAGDSLARRNLLLLPIPSYRDIRNVSRAMVIRGLLRLRRGDRAGARTDFGAATGLGERMYRREPTVLGALIGRAAISSGARGWERYAVTVGDSTLARRAREALVWAAERPGRFTDLMIAAPDSALVIAADTSLALGMRVEALSNVIAGWIVRPRGYVLGPPRRTRRALHALAQSPDPDFAVMAGIAAATADRMNIFGIAGMMRELESTRR